VSTTIAQRLRALVAEGSAGVLRRLEALTRLLAPPRARTSMDPGERIARRHLEGLGWETLAVNLRIGSDEADLLCLDESGAPVLVEVKSAGPSPGGPEDTVGPRKRAALRRIALRLARETRCAGRVPRIDVVAVRLDAPRGSSGAVERHLIDAVGEGPLRERARGESRWRQGRQ
jgi:Holliday junction resolvase-like predicted endonuclease